MSNSDCFELTQARKYIDEGKFDEALQVLTNLGTDLEKFPELELSFKYLKSI